MGWLPSRAPRLDEAALTAARERMVAEQIEARGIHDERVLAALRVVPRHRFVLPEDVGRAHDDGPLGIGFGQTISQPYIVGLMSAALELTGTERVLEIGAGSGYQTAVLAALAREVFTLEIHPTLAERARSVLSALGCSNVRLQVGDGYGGWPAAAPFDAILLAAAPAAIPRTLLEQLAPHGRAILPVGTREQELVRVRRTPEGSSEERLIAVRFVPMQGDAGDAAARA